MINTGRTVLALAVTLALAACGSGGGGGGGGTPTATSSSGKAVDGYISNATVLCDANGNGLADSGEGVVLTDGQGNFTFTPACASTLVVSGGVNIDTGLPFKGLIKAPGGSTMVTPLTNLIVAGLSPALLTNALGVNVDVRTIDPMTNPELLKRTVAIQQIVQQTANTIGALGQNTTADAIEAMYTEVAKAMGATLTAGTPLIDANGNVNAAVVKSVVERSVTNVSNSSEPALAAAKTTVAGFDKTSVAELTAAAIAAQAEALTKSTNITTDTRNMQSDATIANAAYVSSGLLAVGVAGPVNLTAAGTMLKNLSLANAIGTGATAEESALVNALGDQATLGSVAAPTLLQIGNLDAPTNYLALVDDKIQLSGNTYSLSQFAAGIPDTSGQLAFPLVKNGVPIPMNISGHNSVSIGIAAELTSTTGNGQVLQLMIDNVTVSDSGTISAAAASGATLHVYGKTASGATGNLRLSIPSNFITTGSNSVITLNLLSIFSEIASAASSQPAFQNLANTKGLYNVKLVLSNVELRKTDGSFFVPSSIQVTGSGQSPLTGASLEGKINFQ